MKFFIDTADINWLMYQLKGILNERITMKAKIFFIIFFTMIFNIAGVSDSQANESTDSSEGGKVAFGVYYNSSNNFQFDKIDYTYQNQKYTGSLFYDLSPAFGLSLEKMWTQKRGFGYNIGLNYEFERKYNNVTLTLKDSNNTTTTISGSMNAGGISLLILSGGGNFRWDKGFMVFGISVASISGSQPKALSLTGGGGFYFGGGAFLNSTSLIEITYRSYGISSDTPYVESGASFTAGKTSLQGITIGTKYLF